MTQRAVRRVFSVYTGQPFDAVVRYRDFSNGKDDAVPMIVVKSCQTGRVYCCLAESFVNGDV